MLSISSTDEKRITFPRFFWIKLGLFALELALVVVIVSVAAFMARGAWLLTDARYATAPAACRLKGDTLARFW